MDRDELDAFLARADDVLEDWSGSVDAMTARGTDDGDELVELVELDERELRVVDSYYDELLDGNGDDDDEFEPGDEFVLDVAGRALTLVRRYYVTTTPAPIITTWAWLAQQHLETRVHAMVNAEAEARWAVEQARLRAQLEVAASRATAALTAALTAYTEAMTGALPALADLVRVVGPALANARRRELDGQFATLVARRQLRQAGPASQATTTSRRALTAHPAQRRATTASFQRRRV